MAKTHKGTYARNNEFHHTQQRNFYEVKGYLKKIKKNYVEKRWFYAYEEAKFFRIFHAFSHSIQTYFPLFRRMINFIYALQSDFKEEKKYFFSRSLKVEENEIKIENIIAPYENNVPAEVREVFLLPLYGKKEIIQFKIDGQIFPYEKVLNKNFKKPKVVSIFINKLKAMEFAIENDTELTFKIHSSSNIFENNLQFLNSNSIILCLKLLNKTLSYTIRI